jgi:predicted nucleic acid-binding protein
MQALRSLRQRSPDSTFAVSRLSWMECMVKPPRENDQALADDYRSFFAASHLQVIELTPPVVERATALRARHELRTPDALQVASAFEAGGDVLFLTTNKGFRRVPGLKIEIPA